MRTTTLNRLIQDQPWGGLGIAGNQAGHLEQAGEANNFDSIESSEHAPKGIFPWYLHDDQSFLATNPLSSHHLTLIGSDPIQPEPEMALIVEFDYAQDLIQTSDEGGLRKGR